MTAPDALTHLDGLAEGDALAALLRCCGSRRWADAMARGRPYRHEAALLAAAERAFVPLLREDWLEAFSHHPRIGDRAAPLPAHQGAAEGWAASEQAAVVSATEDVVEALLDGNRAYEARFGHIFIVCATGRSAVEMLALLRERLGNPPDRELAIAAAEQRKITEIRLKKLLLEGP